MNDTTYRLKKGGVPGVAYQSLILALALVFSVAGHAEPEGNSFLLSLSMRQLSLDVYDKGATEPAGTLTNDLLVLPDIGVETAARYPGDGGWGYRFVASAGYFDMDTQEVGSSDRDLGTDARGYYLYAMPVGFYDFARASGGRALRAGLGLGAGYLHSDGDILLTGKPGQPRQSVRLADLAPAYGLFLEYDAAQWSYQLSAYSPEVTEGNFEYNLFDIGIRIRRRFCF